MKTSAALPHESFEDDDDSSLGETAPFFTNFLQTRRTVQQQSRICSILLWTWIFCTIILFFSSVLLFFEAQKLQRSPSYESGFKTDFNPVKPAINIVETRFTGGLELDEHGKWFRSNTTTPQYVGMPNKAIDDAWLDLLSGVDIIISKKEMDALDSKTIREEEEGSYRLSLDVYYSLHCIDLARKGLDFDYYYPDGKVPYFYRDHIDHCLDYLRQAIQCQGDLTPLTYYRRGNGKVPIFGGAHTCRNFEKLDSWALGRKSGHAT